MDELVIRLIIMVVFGAITAAIADSKGRSAVGWFFVGFLFPCIGLIIAIAMSNLKEQEAQRQQMMDEQRRLREQLRQERIKSGAIHTGMDKRIDLHDEALGMNTRQIGPTETELAQLGSSDVAESISPDLASFKECKWLVKLGRHSGGHLSFDRLNQVYRMGDVDENTFVRWTGMQEWFRIIEIPGLLEQLRSDDEV